MTHNIQSHPYPTSFAHNSRNYVHQRSHKVYSSNMSHSIFHPRPELAPKTFAQPQKPQNPTPVVVVQPKVHQSSPPGTLKLGLYSTPKAPSVQQKNMNLPPAPPPEPEIYDGMIDLDQLKREGSLNQPTFHVTPEWATANKSDPHNWRLLFGRPFTGLSEFKIPRVGSDLTKGFEQFKPKSTDLYFGHDFTNVLLSSIFSANYPINDVGVVAMRGVLTRICCTPYLSDPWHFEVVKHNGTLFIHFVKDEQRTANSRSAAIPLQHRLSCYAGHRFEQLCTSNNKSNDPEDPPNLDEEYMSVMTVTLNNHKIVTAAEVDCFEYDEFGNKQYVELKTCRLPANESYLNNFKKTRLLKYYIQSRLSGVKTIACGIRDDKHRLLRVERLDVPTLPQQASHLWDENVCLKFASNFFDWLKQTIVQEGVQYHLAFEKPFRHIRMSCGEHSEILPSWFLGFLTTLQRDQEAEANPEKDDDKDSHDSDEDDDLNTAGANHARPLSPETHRKKMGDPKPSNITQDCPILTPEMIAFQQQLPPPNPESSFPRLGVQKPYPPSMADISRNLGSYSMARKTFTQEKGSMVRLLQSSAIQLEPFSFFSRDVCSQFGN